MALGCLIHGAIRDHKEMIIAGWNIHASPRRQLLIH
jgi:hypothetical protein